MGLKFNGVDGGDGGVRWYDTEKGVVLRRDLDAYGLDHSCTELAFSRLVVKTKPRGMILHPDHKPSPETKGAFYINGICSDENLRITFATGMRDKIVISKNLVDFMFCSTNQSFTSCFRLGNGAARLRNFANCPGYYITYITDSDAQYKFNGREYTHPKMQARAFLYESGDNRHYTIGRPYGKNAYELRDALRKWLPCGTEVGWPLTDAFKALNGEQYDNFDNRENITIHDRYDKTFDNTALYNDAEIEIRYK